MKILMLCLGNICRSPLAEGIFRAKLKATGLIHWDVDSAGTGNWHAGEGPDKRSVLVAKQHGIDISAQRARQLKQRDFQDFDYILAMDSSNLENAKQLARTETEKQKVHLIMESLGSTQAVPDPYYGGPEGFEQVFQMLDAACQAWIDQLKK